MTTTDVHGTRRAISKRGRKEGRAARPPGETQPRHRRRRVHEAAGLDGGAKRGRAKLGHRSTRRGAATSLTKRIHLFLRSSLPVCPLREPMPSVDKVSRCWKGSPGPCCQSSPDAGRPRPMLRGRCPPLQGTHAGFVRGATVLNVLSDMPVVVVVVESRRAVRAIMRVSEIDSHFDVRALLSFTRSLALPLAACTLLQTARHRGVYHHLDTRSHACSVHTFAPSVVLLAGLPSRVFLRKAKQTTHLFAAPTGLGLASRSSSSLLSSRVQSERNPLY